MGLVWRASLVVVLQSVMSEVVEDFEGEEVAGRRNVLVPVEDGAIDNLNLISMPSRIDRMSQPFLL